MAIIYMLISFAMNETGEFTKFESFVGFCFANSWIIYVMGKDND